MSDRVDADSITGLFAQVSIRYGTGPDASLVKNAVGVATLRSVAGLEDATLQALSRLRVNLAEPTLKAEANALQERLRQ